MATASTAAFCSCMHKRALNLRSTGLRKTSDWSFVVRSGTGMAKGLGSILVPATAPGWEPHCTLRRVPERPRDWIPPAATIVQWPKLGSVSAPEELFLDARTAPDLSKEPFSTRIDWIVLTARNCGPADEQATRSGSLADVERQKNQSVYFGCPSEPSDGSKYIELDWLSSGAGDRVQASHPAAGTTVSLLSFLFTRFLASPALSKKQFCKTGRCR
jgi:hypothetical protein